MLTPLRQALHSLHRAPGFTLAATAALALGVGATTAVFAAVDTVLLRPLPYADPGQLVALRHDAPGIGVRDGGLSEGLLAHYGARARTLASVGGWFDRELSLTDGARAERVVAAIATPGLFQTLRVRPLLGRPCGAADADTLAPKAVVLGHALWTRRYGADPAVVGRAVEVNRAAATVAGVMPPDFAFPRPDTQLWFCDRGVPNDAGLAVGGFSYSGVARLRAGARPADAERDLGRALATLGERFPTLAPDAVRRSGLRARVLPLREAVVADVRPTLLLLLAAAGALLVVAWATVGTLVLLRAAAREREVAVRRALGAGAAVLAGGALAEAALLAAAGGGAGLALAAVAVALRFGLLAEQVPRLHELALGARGVGVALLLACLSAALLGALAHARAGRAPVAVALSGPGGRVTAGRRAQRGRRALVVAQVALSLALLVCSALLGRSAWRLLRAELGFDPRDVTTLEVALPFSGYRTYDRSAHFFNDLVGRLRAVPGVQGAEATTDLPLTPVAVYMDRPVAAGEVHTSAVLGVATPGYFRVMRTRLVAGRTFAPGDLLGDHPAAVVSASLARTLFGDGPAVGRVVRVGRRGATAVAIVGVVADVPGATIQDGPVARLYLPVLEDFAGAPAARQLALPVNPGELTVVVRSTLPQGALVPAVRRLVAGLDPKVPVGRVGTLEGLVAAATARVRLTALLFVLTTAGSLFLSAVGLYGVVAYAARLRWRELGVRLAVGATPNDVRRLVLAQGVRVAGVGVVVGLVAALALSRLLGALLYGVSPTEPGAYALAALALLAVALAASYAPARRAARLDPAAVLRSD